MEKMVEQKQESTRKRTLEGTNLTTSNPFVVLDNANIARLAGDMGIDCSSLNFYSIDLIKDLEIARHALEKPKNSVNEGKSEEEDSTLVPISSIPPLEWIEEDSEEERFTLVQSRKKKKGTVHLHWKIQ
jgi:hypothetical protein